MGLKNDKCYNPRMLTVEEIQNKVEQIRRVAGDPEAAHGMQDELYRTVLAHIVRGEVEDPKTAARAALMVEEIEFPRWRA